MPSRLKTPTGKTKREQTLHDIDQAKCDLYKTMTKPAMYWITFQVHSDIRRITLKQAEYDAASKSPKARKELLMHITKEQSWRII